MAAKKYRRASGEAGPSVTTVLKNLGWCTAPLMFWSFRMGQENPDAANVYAIDEAAQIGTLVHKLIEVRVLGRPAPTIPETLRESMEHAYASFEQ